MNCSLTSCNVTLARSEEILCRSVLVLSDKSFMAHLGGRLLTAVPNIHVFIINIYKSSDDYVSCHMRPESELKFVS